MGELVGRRGGRAKDDRRRLVVTSAAAAFGFVSILSVCACNAEKRVVGASAPVTAPTGRADPRLPSYESNKYQQSQGGLYFTWYGCGGCHAQSSPQPQNFSRQAFIYGGDVPSLYASISGGRPGGMPAYKDRIPAQQIWQLAAYVKTLPKMNPYLRRREDLDQKGQPTGTTWSGAVR
jgi:mono/diheme cytochrome c family protein